MMVLDGLFVGLTQLCFEALEVFERRLTHSQLFFLRVFLLDGLLKMSQTLTEAGHADTTVEAQFESKLES